LGYALQPRNGPRKLRLMTIGLPHFSQAIPVSTGFTGLPCASASSAFLHFGYALHARNGPRLPSRSTIGLPHLSQTCAVGRLDSTACPSALRFMVVLHSG